jgi:hypothetical protein
LITPSRSFSGCKPSLIPEEGVSYEALEQFSQEHNIKGLSVDQVCELLVKPATLHRKAAYTEIFKGKDPRFVGRANVFVSHAWLCKMTDLLSALRNWLDSLPDEQRVLPWFFWIDVLVCNQEVSGPKDFDWWRKTFKHSVETIGHTVIVMTPWKNPTYIQRAWCLFEFYTTLKCGIPYDITMSAQDQTGFMEELKSGKDVFSHIAQIDIGLAEAKFQTDKDNIMKCMEVTCPFIRVGIFPYHEIHFLGFGWRQGTSRLANFAQHPRGCRFLGVYVWTAAHHFYSGFRSRWLQFFPRCRSKTVFSAMFRFHVLA